MLSGLMNKKTSSKEFFELEQQFVSQGYEVVNPFRIPAQKGWGYEDVVTYLVSVLPTCDIINFLPDAFAPVYDREGQLLCYLWHDNLAEILFCAAKGINTRRAKKKETEIHIWSELLIGDSGHE